MSFESADGFEAAGSSSASSSSLSPRDYADLVGWYCADQMQVADGATIATWRDRSGCKNDLTGTDLTYSAAGLGSKPGFLFNGSSAYAALSNPQIPSGALGWTVVLVALPLALSANMSLVEIGSANNNAHGYQAAITSDGGWYLGAPDGTSNRYTAAGAVTATGLVLAVSKTIAAWGSADPKLYINGSLVAGARGSGTATPDVNPTSLIVGAQLAAAGQFFNGLIGEVQLYAAARSASEVADLTTALRTRWGV